MDIKLLEKNVISKSIEKFFLKNINKLLYKIAEFTKSLITIDTNIIADSLNINFAFLNQTSDNLLINSDLIRK